MSKITLVCLATVLLAGMSACSSVDMPEVETPGILDQARAELIDAEGKEIGTATLSKTDQGVSVSLEVEGLPPGEHGFHIHEYGDCTPPDFESAGGHLALAGQQHGFDVEGGPHLGDLRNLTVSEDGTAEVERTVDGATLDEGEHSLLNRAIVVHADPDDYESQPSGAAGARIACGVIEADPAPIIPRPIPGT